MEDLWWSLFSFSLLEVLSDSQLTHQPLAGASENLVVCLTVELKSEFNTSDYTCYWIEKRAFLLSQKDWVLFKKNMLPVLIPVT